MPLFNDDTFAVLDLPSLDRERTRYDLILSSVSDSSVSSAFSEDDGVSTDIFTASEIDFEGNEEQSHVSPVLTGKKIDEITRACEQNDFKSVNRLTKSLSDNQIEQLRSGGLKSPLRIAALAGNYSIVAMLLRRRFIPKSDDYENLDEVSSQLIRDWVVCLRFVQSIDSSSSREIQLLRAAWFGKLNQMKVFMNENEINSIIFASDPILGNSTLHLAAMTDKSVVVKLLIAHGAPVDVRNKAGQNPLDVGIAYNSLNFLKIFLTCSQSTSHQSISVPHFVTDEVRDLVDGFQKIEVRNPIMKVSREDRKLNKLFDLIEQVDGPSKRLSNKVESGRKSNKQIVISPKPPAPVSVNDEYQFAQLVKAAIDGDLNRVIQFMRRKGNSMYGRRLDSKGFTPLMYACVEGHYSLVSKLLDISDVNQINERGENAFILATKAGHEKVCELLALRGAKSHIGTGSQIQSSTCTGIKYSVPESINVLKIESKDPLFLLQSPSLSCSSWFLLYSQVCYIYKSSFPSLPVPKSVPTCCLPVGEFKRLYESSIVSKFPRIRSVLGSEEGSPCWLISQEMANDMFESVGSTLRALSTVCIDISQLIGVSLGENQKIANFDLRIQDEQESGGLTGKNLLNSGNFLPSKLKMKMKRKGGAT